MGQSKVFRRGGSVLIAGIFTTAFAATTARPGIVNYVEGQVSLDGQAITSKAQGSAEVQSGHVLSTNQGKAEMLLVPGVYLRMSDHAAVKMVTPSLSDTRVEVLKGEAMVEADQVLKGNRIVISDHGIDTQIEKHGLYRFTTDPPQIAVYDGKAKVVENDRAVEIGKGKELALAQTGETKAQRFDRQQPDNLYQWSSVRSEYLSEANQSYVNGVAGGYPGWGWYGPNWYWNPWFSSWAFVPGGFDYFYSPFGFGYYSPIYWRTYAPYYYHPGVGRVGVVGRGAVIGRAPVSTPAMRAPAMRAPAMRAPTMSAPAMRGGFGGRR
jgi:hypothetical protein